MLKPCAGGVHVCEGVVQPLDGRMRIHIFDYAEDAGSLYMHSMGSPYIQRKANGFW